MTAKNPLPQPQAPSATEVEPRPPGDAAFGPSLRTARIRQRLSVRELGRRTFYSHSYVSKIENGVKHPSAEFARQCDRTLELDGALLQLLVAPVAADRWPRPAQLPPGPARFAGHAAELALLTASLVRDRCPSGTVPLVAVTGPPGVGKTALVVRWAHQNTHLFPDGVLYADLGGHGGAPRSPAVVLEDFLEALGSDRVAADLTRPVSLLGSLLHDKKLLVVLDDAASVQQVRALLPGAPGCAIVVTSRHRLSGLSVRDGARGIDVRPLNEVDSVGLLGELAGADRVHAEPESAAAVARACAGLPLALCLAGGRLAALPDTTFRAFAVDLQADDRVLDALTVLGDPRSAVRTVFSWSYLALDERDARVFRLLGLQPGPGFDTAAVVSTTGLPASEIESSLERLTEAHLVESTGRNRYELHHLLRVYARERYRLTESIHPERVPAPLTWTDRHTTDEHHRPGQVE
ncbi:helix-turn-helix domain-containing protein [Actinosynnema sp. NPDC023794]